MAGSGSMLKFLSPRLRPQSTQIQAAATWGVCAGAYAFYVVQPFDWIRKTFLETPEQK